MARNRILVVEDEPAISNVIVKNLSATGYAVHACFDGLEALQLLESGRARLAPTEAPDDRSMAIDRKKQKS